jgi:hypothetical protein
MNIVCFVFTPQRKRVHGTQRGKSGKWAVVHGPVETKHEDNHDENDGHILWSVQPQVLPQYQLHLEVSPTK